MLVPTSDAGWGRGTAPAISRFLCTWNLKFLLVLGASLKVSENFKLIEYLLFGHHGNCSGASCFCLIFAET